jgi:hypothetical protein
MHIIKLIINTQYNYYISNKCLIDECNTEENLEVAGLHYFLFGNKTVKRYVQWSELVQSPPGRHVNNKYPVDSLQRSQFFKKFHWQYYLVTTAIQIRSLRCQMYVYNTSSAQYGDACQVK